MLSNDLNDFTLILISSAVSYMAYISTDSASILDAVHVTGSKRSHSHPIFSSLVIPHSRGVTLLSVHGKIFGIVLINRIKDRVDKELKNGQAGFRKGRSTVERLSILRNIIEQSVECQAGLCINFVDFEKAFDSVHRESLWNIMRCYGIYQKNSFEWCNYFTKIHNVKS